MYGIHAQAAKNKYGNGGNEKWKELLKQEQEWLASRIVD